MKVLLTGAGGFLGWHTRLRLVAESDHEVVAVGREEWPRLRNLLNEVDAVIHVAGVNRGDDAEVEAGNVSLAEDVASAVTNRNHPVRIVFANSIQDGNGTAYGRGKASASAVLRTAAERVGGQFVDVRLPNLFGEHGRPSYNSFVATFVAAVIAGEVPTVHNRSVELLHVQGAAQALLEALVSDAPRIDPHGEQVGVQETLDLLRDFRESYDEGAFPDLSTPFRVALFNTYRASLFPAAYPLRLVPHADHRGRFVETVRCLGGQGQSSVSTTVPGMTRGDHYHLTKIERFVVLQGTATISLRRMFTGEVHEFAVSGEEPVAVDMPTGWAHNITNTGNDILLTQFWAHEPFRAEAPDTYPEPVRPPGVNA